MTMHQFCFRKPCGAGPAQFQTNCPAEYKFKTAFKLKHLDSSGLKKFLFQPVFRLASVLSSQPIALWRDARTPYAAIHFMHYKYYYLHCITYS